jgi:ubiquinone/menaquinone biosynthesis C-methylase UbiE
MLEQLRKHDWAAQVQSEVMDAQELKYPDDKFTHSFTNFALMAIPDPAKAAKQIYRTLKPGGTAALTTWKQLGLHGHLPRCAEEGKAGFGVSARATWNFR